MERSLPRGVATLIGLNRDGVGLRVCRTRADLETAGNSTTYKKDGPLQGGRTVTDLQRTSGERRVGGALIKDIAEGEKKFGVFHIRRANMRGYSKSKSAGGRSI